MLTFGAAVVVLAGIAFAKPLAVPQGLDFDVVNELPPAPSVSIPVGVLSQVIVVAEASVLASVAALATKVPLTDVLDGVVSIPPTTAIISDAPVVKRAASSSTTGSCIGGNPQPTGSGPVSSPDTPAGYRQNSAYGNAAKTAATPSGYMNSFTNLTGATSAYAYLGFSSITTYNPATCATQCNTINGCQAFNICKSVFSYSALV